MYLGVTAAAEPCSACLTRRALQGQYILSAPYCQLSPSSFTVAWLRKPSKGQPALSHCPSSGIPALPR